MCVCGWVWKIEALDRDVFFFLLPYVICFFLPVPAYKAIYYTLLCCTVNLSYEQFLSDLWPKKPFLIFWNDSPLSINFYETCFQDHLLFLSLLRYHTLSVCLLNSSKYCRCFIKRNLVYNERIFLLVILYLRCLLGKFFLLLYFLL